MSIHDPRLYATSPYPTYELGLNLSVGWDCRRTLQGVMAHSSILILYEHQDLKNPNRMHAQITL